MCTSAHPNAVAALAVLHGHALALSDGFVHAVAFCNGVGHGFVHGFAFTHAANGHAYTANSNADADSYRHANAYNHAHAFAGVA